MKIPWGLACCAEISRGWSDTEFAMAQFAPSVLLHEILHTTFAAAMRNPRRRIGWLLLLPILAAFLPSFAHAAGNADRGKVLARVWCANCHIVDPEGTGTDGAPPFPLVAQKGAPEQREARAFLNAPHPPMPNFNLAREQIDDIVAYLNSLAKN